MKISILWNMAYEKEKETSSRITRYVPVLVFDEVNFTKLKFELVTLCSCHLDTFLIHCCKKMTPFSNLSFSSPNKRETQSLTVALKSNIRSCAFLQN